MSDQPSRQQRRAAARAGRPPKSWVPAVGWVVGVLAVVGIGWWLSRPADSDGDANQLATQSDLEQCVSHGGSLSLHIHPHLRIIVDGEERAIPANTGVTSNCLLPLHTHDGTGVIHIESPRVRDFTIGQFFSIWQETYTAEKFMDIDLTAERQLQVYADGQAVSTGASTIMKDKMSYVIMVGQTGETLTPPANYEFSPNI